MIYPQLSDEDFVAGFAWGKFGPNLHRAVRCKDELIWGIELPAKKGFFSKLFG